MACSGRGEILGNGSGVENYVPLFGLLRNRRGWVFE